MNDLEQSKAWRLSRLASKRYKQSGNPLYLFESAGIALEAGIPLTSEALQYLTKVTKSLGQPVNSDIKSVRDHVFRCLDFKTRGGASLFYQRRIFETDLKLKQLAQALKSRTEQDQLFENAGRDPDSFRRLERKRRKTLEKLNPLNKG